MTRSDYSVFIFHEMYRKFNEITHFQSKFTVAKNFQPVKHFQNDASSPSHPSFSSQSPANQLSKKGEKKTNKQTKKRRKESYSTVTLQTVSRVEKTIHARAILPQVSRVGPGAPYRTSTSRRKVGGRRVSGLTPREIESKGVDEERREERKRKRKRNERERERERIFQRFFLRATFAAGRSQIITSLRLQR